MELPDFARVRALLFDVDGVMTDSKVLVTEAGELLRTMSIRDGYALKRAVRSDLRVAVITGGSSVGVRKRLLALGIRDYYSGVEEKLPTVRAYLARHEIDPDAALYMGDDLPDLPAMRYVGLACAPADACPQALAAAAYVSPHVGGAGCVREVVERVMTAQSTWLPT